MYVIYEGNATADAELRFTGNGKAVAGFTVAVNTRSKDQAGNYVDDEPLFVRATVWDKPGEHVAQSVKKGARVIIAGRQKITSYTTQAGEQRTSTEVTAEEVGLSLRFDDLARVGGGQSQPRAATANSQGEGWGAQNSQQYGSGTGGGGQWPAAAQPGSGQQWDQSRAQQGFDQPPF